jgi:hypothetical protein
MLKTTANPGGLAMEVFDEFQAQSRHVARSSIAMLRPGLSTDSTGRA